MRTGAAAADRVSGTSRSLGDGRPAGVDRTGDLLDGGAGLFRTKAMEGDVIVLEHLSPGQDASGDSCRVLRVDDPEGQATAGRECQLHAAAPLQARRWVVPLDARFAGDRPRLAGEHEAQEDR